MEKEETEKLLKKIKISNKTVCYEEIDYDLMCEEDMINSSKVAILHMLVANYAKDNNLSISNIKDFLDVVLIEITNVFEKKNYEYKKLTEKWMLDLMPEVLDLVLYREFFNSDEKIKPSKKNFEGAYNIVINALDLIDEILLTGEEDAYFEFTDDLENYLINGGDDDETEEETAPFKNIDLPTRMLPYIIKTDKYNISLKESLKLIDEKDFKKIFNDGDNIKEIADDLIEQFETIANMCTKDMGTYHFFNGLLENENTGKICFTLKDAEQFNVILYLDNDEIKYFIPSEIKKLIIKFVENFKKGN